MKLNAAAELYPLSWREFADLHPFVPQGTGCRVQDNIFGTGKNTLQGDRICCSFPAPNSGAQGEFTGLMVIRAYHHDHSQAQRIVVLIPASAHGTNPASAVMAGMQVVVVACDANGNIDVDDLRENPSGIRTRSPH